MIGTYFTVMLRASIGNKREWYVEEMRKSNSLYPIHKAHKLVFSTFEECEKACELRVEKEGGTYTRQLPVQGRKYGT